MRVALDAHTVGRQQTGNERYVVELGNALAARDDVEVVALIDEGTNWPVRGTDARPRIEYLRLRRPQLRIPIELPLAARRLRADVLQVSYVAPPVCPVPLVTVIHDVSFEDLPDQFPLRTRLRMKAMVRLAARQSAALICVSRFTRDRVLALYGPAPDRVHFVAEGVHPRWKPLPPADLVRARAELKLPPRFVFAVGSDHPRKNLPRLIAALAIVRAQGLGDVELVLAGPRGAGSGAISGAIEANHAAGWVRHLGYIDDDVLQTLYCAADVVAYPSLYEGFGLPALEALACGAVLVTSNSTSLPEVCGEAAILVDPQDVDAIGAGLHAALTEDALRLRLGVLGPPQAARFSWTNAAAATVEVYRSVLGRAR